MGVDLVVYPSAEAERYGWSAVFGADVLECELSRCGRGERARTSGTRQIRGCTVVMGGQRPLLGLTRTA